MAFESADILQFFLFMFCVKYTLGIKNVLLLIGTTTNKIDFIILSPM